MDLHVSLWILICVQDKGIKITLRLWLYLYNAEGGNGKARDAEMPGIGTVMILTITEEYLTPVGLNNAFRELVT